VAVADVHYSYAACEVDQLSAFHVMDHCAPSAFGKERGSIEWTLRHESVPLPFQIGFRTVHERSCLWLKKK
jgi:hypothetical protein